MRVLQEEVLSRFAEMIRIPTVSSLEGGDEAPFEAFRDLIKKEYPLVFARGDAYLVGKRGILIKIPGRSSAEPSVLMAHYDVVPASDRGWKYPPFSAERSGGRIYGRGTLDTKCSVCSILEAVSACIADGYVPENDIWLSFGGEEEVSGSCCGEMVSFLKESGVKPAFVLDEGGAVIPEGMPGLKRQAAMIGISEKGTVNYLISFAGGGGGHASTPPRSTLLGRMARAVTSIERHPFPARISKPVELMFKELSREVPFYEKFIFSHPKLLEPFVKAAASRMGISVNAMMRTTAAVTVMEGHSAFNVLPDSAAFGVNVRLIHGDTIESAKKKLAEIIGDPEAKIEVISGSDPSPVSDTECDGYRMLKEVIGEVWQGTPAAPYPLNGGTDARFYNALTDRVYRFSPMIMTKEERATIHGVNESIAEETLMTMISFYIKLVNRL